MTKPVCFVLMPFGVKMDAAGRAINFDHVYEQIFKPAVIAADLLPIRADEEQAQGFIHKLMYERLLLSEYAIADLTLLNANVYYELGVRHAAKPSTTVMTMAGQSGLPFDVAGLRVLPYALDPTGNPIDAPGASKALADQLRNYIEREFVDSPIYQLVTGLKPLPIDPTLTDIFRERTKNSEDLKGRIAAARASNEAASIASLEQSLGSISDLEASVALDLLISYRAVSAHREMIDLIGKLDRKLSQSVMVRQMLAFAQNKLGQWQEAEEILIKLIAVQGPSSEASGLLGSVYKNRWEKATKAGEAYAAKAYLKQAINSYIAGFEADWRDPYPGVNALTLMEVADDSRRHALLPVVRYLSERRIAGRGHAADYWDYASLLEIAVLADDSDLADDTLGQALTVVEERWQLEATARNLRVISEARVARHANIDAVNAYLQELIKNINGWSNRKSV
jgi:tetratricopeptide (TPR) repeat protein